VIHVQLRRLACGPLPGGTRGILCFRERRLRARVAVCAQVSALAVVLLLSGCGGSSGRPAQTQHRADLRPPALPVTQEIPQGARHPSRQHDPTRPQRRNRRPAHPTNATPIPRARVHQREHAQPQEHPQRQERLQHRVATSYTPARAPNPTSGKAAKFKKSYQSVVAQLTQSSRAIGTSLREAPSRTGAQILTTFRGLASRWQSQLSQLQTLKPPLNLVGDFNALTGAGTRVESDLNAIVAATANRSRAAGEQAVARIVMDILAARAADSTIEQKLTIK
jgi:hypothetical protein